MYLEIGNNDKLLWLTEDSVLLHRVMYFENEIMSVIQNAQSYSEILWTKYCEFKRVSNYDKKTYSLFVEIIFNWNGMADNYNL